MTRTYTIVFKNGTEKSGLTYDEAEDAMRRAELTENDWVRVYVDQTDYKTP